MRGMGLILNSNFDFTTLALQEMAKYSKSKMISLAAQLAEGVKSEHYQNWGSRGFVPNLLISKDANWKWISCWRATKAPCMC
jgi:hypothetical protein